MANGDLSGGGIAGTAQLPEPPRSSWTRTLVPKGSRIDTADGSAVFDLITTKWKWSFSWTLLTQAKKDALESAILAITGTPTFTDWEGTVASVQPLLSTLAITPVLLSDGSTRRYTVSITFEGV